MDYNATPSKSYADFRAEIESVKREVEEIAKTYTLDDEGRMIEAGPLPGKRIMRHSIGDRRWMDSIPITTSTTKKRSIASG